MALGWLLCVLAPGPALAEPAISGYQEYEAFRQSVLELGTRHGVTIQSLAETGEQRHVWLITISESESPEQKPALLILGNVFAPQLVGSELALRMAERLSSAALSDDDRELLARFTLYIVPRPNPDGSQAFFQQPWREHDGNARPTDDDRDGETAEDPPEDLNGDGHITLMRVEDPAGEYLPHPDDDRILIRAKPEQGEQGRWSLYVEGVDNDGDGAFNEDAGDGVSFNRNFTFDYPYFKPGAGPHQVSEPETRGVADFAFEHPNIVAVFAFAPQGNLVRPWKVNKSAEQQRIKTSLLTADEPYYEHFGKVYRELLDRDDSYDEVPAAGDFARWGYFHYGRWSLAARAWWIPRVEPSKPAEQTNAESAAAPTSVDVTLTPSAHGQAAAESQAPRPQYIAPRRSPAIDTLEDSLATSDKDVAAERNGPGEVAASKPADTPAEKKIEVGDRGAAELQALRWFEQQEIDGFVAWEPFDHPDFPGRRVEIGGFKPFLQWNPPAAELDPLAEQHVRFVLKLLADFPRLELRNAEIASLGGGLFRVRVTVLNQGYLPTASAMGEISRKPYPLELRLVLPEGAEVLTGSPRVRLDVLRGMGGTSEQVWIVRLPDEVDEIQVEVTSPTVGAATTTLSIDREESR